MFDKTGCPENARCRPGQRIWRALTPEGSTPAPRARESYVSAEEADRAANRLCWIALSCAVTTIAMFLLQGLLQPEVAAAQKRPLVQLTALFLVLDSVALIVMRASRRVSNEIILRWGLLFEVVGAFSLAIFEYTLPFDPAQPVRGISWVALWISVCTLLIPAAPLRSLATALGAAAMGPLAYYLDSSLYRYAALPANRLTVLFFPNFLMAGWSFLLSRTLYRLQVDINKSQDMGSYHLEALLGSGGMGEVWRAQHRMLAREAAIKLIRPEILISRTGREASVLRRRFEQEARFTASLRSPHTVELYDFGMADDGSFFYAMELLEGIDLESLVTRFGPQPPSRVIFLLRQVCDSLAEAHSVGLVHRDIKPTNLFICKLGLHYDFVKVLDFGLVKRALSDGQTQMTMEGTTTGTPAYMPPEIALGNPDVDGRADLYSLGCVAYFLLTGALVFDEKNPMSVALAHVQQEPVPVSQRSEQPIPASLERIVMACLNKKPENRPKSAVELSALLAEAGAGGAWTEHDAERWWQINLPDRATASVLAAAAASPTHTL